MTAPDRLRALVAEATGGEPWRIYEETHHEPTDDPKWTERYVTEGGSLMNYEPGDWPLRKIQLIALAPQLAELCADMARELNFALLSPAQPKEHREAIDAGRGCPFVTPDCLWCSMRRVLARLDALFSEET